MTFTRHLPRPPLGGHQDYYPGTERVRQFQGREHVHGQPSILDPFHDINLGNEVLLKNPGILSGSAVRLISADLTRYVDATAQNANWNWTLTIGIQTPAVTSTSLPIVAKIAVGSGGVMRDFEVSVVPATSVNIIGPICNVDVLFDTSTYGGTIAPTVADQLVYATISRGAAVSTPHRWFWVSPNPVTQPIISGPVPRHAKKVSWFGQRSIYTGTNILRFHAINTGTELARYTGTELLSALLQGQYLPVPVGCANWSLEYSVGALNSYLSFELEI